jgi:pimeloyl-ACP methyl ester carboxylesterase
VYVDALEHNGFAGPLNWYRKLRPQPGVLAPFEMATINCPALFIGVQDDHVLQFMPPSLMEVYVTDLRECIVMPGVAHCAPQNTQPS